MDLNINRPRNSTEKNGKPKPSQIIAGIIVLLVIIILFVFPPYITIPTGHTGVVTTFGKVADYTLGEGFHVKNPIAYVVIMDNRTQKKVIPMQAFSKDIQQVDVVSTVNFKIDQMTAQDLYQTVGSDYYDMVMAPRVQETVKAIFTQYSAESLMEVRSKLSGEIKNLLAPEMKVYGIEVISVSIEDVDFTDAFTDAVESKQVAEQTKLKVETEQAQQVSIETSAAERRVIAARADAQEREILAEANAAVARVNADAKAYSIEIEAKAEAEANKMIAASITDILIDYQEMSTWDGKLPEIYAGGGALPVLDLARANTSEAKTTP